MQKGKRGISPIIATILLIVMVVVFITLIFLWLKGTIKDAITKGGENVELVCEKIKLRASYSNNKIEIVNDGDYPIYNINIIFEKVGTSETKDLKTILPNWPKKGIVKGGSFSGDISSSMTDVKKLIVIPVLRGASNKGERTYDCGENYGVEVTI